MDSTVLHQRWALLLLVEISLPDYSCFIMFSSCLSVTKFNLGADHLTCGGGYGWFFFSFSNFFSDNTRFRILLFFVARRTKFFSLQNLTLGYMTKTVNQIFFFLHQNRNIFFSNIGNQNIFLGKNDNSRIIFPI